MLRQLSALLSTLTALLTACGSSRSSSAAADFPSLAAGEHRWSVNFASDGNVAARDLALLPDGDLLVVGSFEQSVAVADRTAHSAGDADGFVARLSPRGTAVWLRRIGGAGPDAVEVVTAATDGTIAIAGAVSAEARVGEGLPAPPPPPDTTSKATVAFVAALDSRGAPRWIQYVHGDSYAAIVGLCHLADGSLVAVGYFGESVRVGERRLTSAGDQDIIAIRFSANGTPLWARRAGGPGADLARGVAALHDRIVVVGSYGQRALFGNAELESMGGGQDAFVAALDLEGSVVAVEGYGGEGADAASAVAADSRGGYCVTGTFTDTASFGGSDLETRGEGDVFLACYGADGSHDWSRSMGGPGSDLARAIDLGRADVVIAGTFAEKGTFAGQELTASGGHDVFVAKLTRQGVPVWGRSFGAAGQEDLGGVAVEPRGGVAIAGTFARRISFGGEELAARGMLDGFAARLTD